jgi:hypothetical protein
VAPKLRGNTPISETRFSATILRWGNTSGENWHWSVCVLFRFLLFLSSVFLQESRKKHVSAKSLHFYLRLCFPNCMLKGAIPTRPEFLHAGFYSLSRFLFLIFPFLLNTSCTVLLYFHFLCLLVSCFYAEDNPERFTHHGISYSFLHCVNIDCRPRTRVALGFPPRPKGIARPVHVFSFKL